MAKLSINYQDQYGTDRTEVFNFIGNKAAFDNWVYNTGNDFYNLYINESQDHRRIVDVRPDLLQKEKLDKTEERIESIKQQAVVNAVVNPMEAIEKAEKRIRREVEQRVKLVKKLK